VLTHLGLGPASIRIPCRVAYVIREPLLRGFAYGTLPGHPEAGEERFALEQHGDGTISIGDHGLLASCITPRQARRTLHAEGAADEPPATCAGWTALSTSAHAADR
jgi:uncharacterized protein DUF1990